MREYNVILRKGVDYDEFWNDIESDTDGGKLYIPNRKVEFTNERAASLRQCWYLLTDEEAEKLKLDDRVFDVEIPPEYRDDIQIGLRAIQTGDFTKTTSDSGVYLNWGMIRCNSTTNVYGSGTTTNLNYNYTLTGEGVDIVIQDSGIEVNHPEFLDEFGNNRVQQIDWSGYQFPATFTQNANHYRDYDGHGTHVASTAAGLTYGWAKKARIYSQKLSGLEGSGDSGTGISATYAFDAIKAWHNNKAGSRPTVVNMSWGYYTTFATLTEINYRGTSYTGTSIDTNAERINNFGLMTAASSVSNIRISSVDTDIQEMIDAGIVVCIAAGNRSHKIDVPSGTDYNNYYNDGSGATYYHRGSSPYDDEAFMVGNIDSTVYDTNNDQKSTSSETGPGVTIYAPGTNIMGACSTINAFTDEPYYLNSSYRQMNISGTSMASPQVAGVCALFLEANPRLTPAQLKSAILANAGTAIYDTGVNNDWTNYRSLKGGTLKVLYNKFNSEKTLSATNVTFSGIAFKIR
jgi:subtilisin family serine protease